MTRRPSVLIADDHPVVAEGLAVSLERWFRVAGIVDTLEGLADALRLDPPAVVVLDLSFGEVSSLRILPKLVRKHPATRFVILTGHGEPVLVDAALRAGASAFVVKQSAPAELRVAIEEALANRTYVTPKIRQHGPPLGTEPGRDPRQVALSDRQLRILGCLRTGHTYREIADTLGISTKTVEYHVNALRRKIGVSSTSQLIRWMDEVFGGEPPTPLASDAPPVSD